MILTRAVTHAETVYLVGGLTTERSSSLVCAYSLVYAHAVTNPHQPEDFMPKASYTLLMQSRCLILSPQKE